MKKAIFVRHVERIKGDDAQNLTLAGQIVASAMGLVFKARLQPEELDLIHTVYTSPQPRGLKTALHFLATMFAEHDIVGEFAPVSAKELDDFSSDKRIEVAEALKKAKELAKLLGIDTEAAIYAVEGGLNAVRLKATEAMSLISRTLKEDGYPAFIGLHGGTIDQLHWEFVHSVNSLLAEGPGCKGGVFSHGEGFIVWIDNEGKTYRIQVVRQPTWLKAEVASMLGDE